MKLFSQTQGQGPDMVLLHGWAMHSGIWQPVMQHLTQHWRVTVIDLPGHGKSRNVERRAWDDEILHGLIDVAPEQAVWVGWSISGMLALQIAQLFPDRVRKLIMVAANPRFPQSDDWPNAVDMNVLQQFHDALVNDYQKTLRRFFALQVKGSDEARSMLRQLRELMQNDLPPAPQTLTAGLEYLRDTDLRSDIAKLPHDALWLAGSHDTLVPVAVEQSIQAIAPQVKTHVIHGAGHVPFLSHTENFINVIKAFINE